MSFRNSENFWCTHTIFKELVLFFKFTAPLVQTGIIIILLIDTQLLRLGATCIHREPAALTTVYLVCRLSRTSYASLLDPQPWPSFLRIIWPVHCHFNQLIYLAMLVIPVFHGSPYFSYDLVGKLYAQLVITVLSGNQLIDRVFLLFELFSYISTEKVEK